MRLKIFGAVIVLAISFSPWSDAAGTYQEPEVRPGHMCTKKNCLTTCTGPMGVECCCFYECPSGGTWVCKQGEYCPETSRSCLP